MRLDEGDYALILSALETIAFDYMADCADTIEKVQRIIDDHAKKEAWEPVEAWKEGYKYSGIKVEGGRLDVWEDDVFIIKNLPEDIRLCRRVEEEGEERE